MQIFREEEILDEEFRRKVIEEIEGQENQARKKEAYKRYEVYKDRTNLYVEDLLRLQFDESTVEEMQYAITNIGIYRKIINKLARVYSNGVSRCLDSKTETKFLKDLYRHLKFDSKIKKANRYVRIFKNILVMPKPKPVQFDENGVPTKFDIKLSILAPFLYDVIENSWDKEEAKVVILSDFSISGTHRYSLDPANEGRTFSDRATIHQRSNVIGDGKDQIIADTRYDRDPTEDKKYTWWSDNYHFTTSASGKIISADIDNPIGTLPAVTLAEDQDGEYWSAGGSDAVDGAILVNSMLTNTNHIGVSQGYGQAVLIGKNLPKKLTGGPNKVVILEQKEGEPTPSFDFKTSNAPLSELQTQAIQYIALLLTTNNLSTSGVRTELGKGVDAPSGVAMMIDKAESIEDVQDQAQLFHDKEPEILDKIVKWTNLYRDKKLLKEDLIPFNIQNSNVSLKFGEQKQISTEKEKLETIQLRKDLGIDREVDILMKDDPNLTEKQAEKKLLEIKKEKMNNLMEGIFRPTENTQGEQNNASQEQSAS